MKTLRDFRFQFILSISFSLFFLLKFRSIKRFLPKTEFVEFFAYSAQDFIVFGLVSFLLYQFLPKLRALIIPLFLLTVLNILYISKMGYPITLGLLGQAGDFLFIQTSIQSPSIFRNLGIVLGLTVFISAFYFALLKIKNVPKLMHHLSMSINSLLILISMIFFFLSINNLNGRYYKNILVSFLSPPQTINKVLKSEHFLNLKPERWERHQNNSDSIINKFNIVVVVVETLSHDLNKVIGGEVVFPNLLKLTREAKVYGNHMTSWPFSSKSLYSLICGSYPSPTSIIEMRINKIELCKSWVSELVNKHKYHGLISYSGNLNYDNMRGFFNGLGPLELVDRNQLDRLEGFSSNKLSVDDLSMIESFKSFDKEPFIATFITMNSHFPFWTPREEFKKFGDAYWDSMHYQDHFIGELRKLLEKKGLSKNTILVVTGDHGRRIGQGSDELLPSSMFKVPLLIKIPGKWGEYIVGPSNHADLGSSLYKELTGNHFGLKDFKLNSYRSRLVFFETSEPIFSLIKNHEKLVLKGNGLIYNGGKDWPKISDPTCDIKSCPEKFKEFYINLENLQNIYGL